jgi:hypothetical protein
MFKFGKNSDFDKLKKQFTDQCLGMHKSLATERAMFSPLKIVSFCTSDKRIGEKLYFSFNQEIAEGKSGENIGSKEEEYDFYFYFVENWAGNCIAMAKHLISNNSNYLIHQFLNLKDNEYNTDIYNFLVNPVRVELVEHSSPLYSEIEERVPNISDWYLKRKNNNHFLDDEKLMYLKNVCDKMRL